ncbi:MAG: hypothetical protein AB7I25_01025 [Vicinamibacterales bacterium]
MAQIDTTNWSGDGDFTIRVVAALRAIGEIAFLRVENAPASRSDAGYSFISNEVYVTFEDRCVETRVRLLGLVPVTRRVERPALTLGELERLLSAAPGIGEPDYSDEGMLQYLRTERIVPKYQTKGYKLMELLRIYEAGTPSRASGAPAATAGSR